MENYRALEVQKKSEVWEIINKERKKRKRVNGENMLEGCWRSGEQNGRKEKKEERRELERRRIEEGGGEESDE